MSATKEPQPSDEPLKVSIFNQPYHLRTDGDGDYVKQLARFVDERMQAISSHTSVVDYAKVAVLAALNIADELHRMKAATVTSPSSDSPQNPAPQEGPEEERQATAASVEGRKREGDSWSYSDIFESLPSRENPLPKLGQNITTRLRQLREEGGTASHPEPEE